MVAKMLEKPSTAVSLIPNNTDPKWWKDRGLRKLVVLQACIIISQMTSGYDESIVGSFQTMVPWVNDMGHPGSSTLGLITAVVFIGGFVGAPIAALTADYFGRKVALLVGSLLCILGAVIQTASHGVGMFIGGRVIIGFGISFNCCAGPTLLNEIAHPRMRSTIASMFNVLWYLGSIFAAWITFGTGHMTSSWSWRIPSLLQGVPGLLVIIALPFIPESPRWLYFHGQTSKAAKILSHYHANDSHNDELVEFELKEIKDAMEFERTNSKTWLQVLAVPANRSRFYIVIGVAIMTLWNGQGVISYYFSPILTSVGITGTTRQTGINGGLQIWNLLCSLLGAMLADRIGRRTLWLTSFIGMMFANIPLTICSATYDKHGSNTAAYAVIVFLFFYDAAFNLACNPLLYSYTTEILPFAIRARGLGVMIAVSQAALMVNQYVNPIALDHIGWRYYCFYLGMLVLFTAIIYLYFPETKGYSLEELSHLFEKPGTLPSIEGMEPVERITEFPKGVDKGNKEFGDGEI